MAKIFAHLVPIVVKNRSEHLFFTKPSFPVLASLYCGDISHVIAQVLFVFFWAGYRPAPLNQNFVDKNMALRPYKNADFWGEGRTPRVVTKEKFTAR